MIKTFAKYSDHFDLFFTLRSGAIDDYSHYHELIITFNSDGSPSSLCIDDDSFYFVFMEDNYESY